MSFAVRVISSTGDSPDPPRIVAILIHPAPKISEATEEAFMNM
jgi:hypothetical protein